jgi:hypothetical protein
MNWNSSGNLKTIKAANASWNWQDMSPTTVEIMAMGNLT